MTMKKKVTAATLATGVAFSAFAGIPIIDNNKASAEAVTETVDISSFVNDVKKLRDYFNSSDAAKNDKEAIKEFAKKIENLEDKAVVFSAILSKLEKPNLDLNNLAEDLAALYSTANQVLAGDASKLLDVTGKLGSLRDALGVNNAEGKEKYKNSDFVDYLSQVHTAVYSSITVDQLNDIDKLTTTDAKEAQLVKVIREAINKNSNVTGHKVHSLLKDNKIDSEVLAETIAAIRSVDTAKFRASADALYRAFAELKKDSGNNNGGGGGGYYPPVVIIGDLPNVATASSYAQLVQYLKDIEQKIASKNLTEQQLADYTKASLDATEAFLNKHATIVTNATVVDGVATVNVDAAKTKAVAKDVKEALAQFAKAFPKADAAPFVTLTYDAGAVVSDELVLTLPKELVEEAINAGIKAVKVKTNQGLSMELPIGGDVKGELVLHAKATAAESVQGIIGENKIVSKVYNLSVKADGKEVTGLKKHVAIQIPVGTIGNVDTELLSLARINPDGTVTYLGGWYVNDAIVLYSQHPSFGSYVIVENKVEFEDLASVSRWAEREIKVLAAKGAINGKKDGVYAPNDAVTRAEFAKILVHSLQLQNDFAVSKFTDVAKGSWYDSYVASANELGIINGRSADRFAPNANITRAELATLIARAAQYNYDVAAVTDVDAELKKFADASDIHPTLKQGVALATKLGIVVGKGTGADLKFDPNATATRAEAAVVIYRVFKHFYQ